MDSASHGGGADGARAGVRTHLTTPHPPTGRRHGSPRTVTGGCRLRRRRCEIFVHSRPDGRRPLRVVHCPVNTAGIPWANVQALRRRGVDARLVVFERYKLHPEADESLDLPYAVLGCARQARAVRGARAAPPAHRRLPLLLRADARAEVAPVPAAARARARSPSCTTSARTSAARRPRELAYGRKAGAQVVGSYDAIRWVPEAEVIPPGIDLARDRARAAVRPRAAADRPRALVAPPQGHRARRRRRARGSTPTSSSSRASTTTRRSSATARADIVVDQLNAGWYGVFAIEAMALGKPVVTFLHEEAVRRTEEAFGTRVPIVSATEETLRETLRPLVADAARRRELGAASRAYVERVHDLERVADRLLDLYARLCWSSTSDAAAQLAPARQALGDLRPRRDRLARDRGLPAAGLHALPRHRRLRRGRRARRALGGARDDPARRHLERLLPLHLRLDTTRRAGCSSCGRRSGSRWRARRSGSSPALLLAEPIADAARASTTRTSSAPRSSASGRR